MKIYMIIFIVIFMAVSVQPFNQLTDMSCVIVHSFSSLHVAVHTDKNRIIRNGIQVILQYLLLVLLICFVLGIDCNVIH